MKSIKKKVIKIVFIVFVVLLIALGFKGMREDYLAAFMITGPATKITNLGALKSVLGLKHFVFYLIYIILFALITGLIIDIIF